MPTMFPMPDEYGGAFEGLTDEQRKRFLEEYAPGAISTGPVTRGAQGFTPLPMPKVSASGAASMPAPAEDSDLMRRFMGAQQKGARNATLSGLGASLDNAGRLYAGLPERSGGADPSIRSRPVADVMQAEGLKAQQRNTARQTELDAVNLAKTKAETARAEAGARSTEADEKREAALADPKSPESAALRETATALLVDQYGAPTIPTDKLASMSGIQIREALKFGTSRLNADAQAFIGQQRVNNEREAARTAAYLRSQGIESAEYIAQLVIDSRESEGEKGRELQEELAKARTLLEAQKHERDRSEKLGEREVGGFEFENPSSPPSAEASKKMAAVSIANAAIAGSLNNLEKLFKKHGTEITGDVATTMQSEWKNITDQVRIIGEMGVPNGSDYKMLALQIPQTVGVRAGVTPNSWIQPKFQTLRGQMDRLVGATARAYKFKPKGGLSGVGTADAPAPARTTYADPERPDVDLEADPKPPPVRQTSAGQKPQVPAQVGKPSREDRKFDPTKKEARRVYSKDGQWLRIVYTDGTFGLGPSDKKKGN